MSAHMPGCKYDPIAKRYTERSEGCAAPEEHEPPGASPETTPAPGSDARGLPDGTLVTCEHCATPHPKGDDGRPCLFPQVAQ
jgi:hypothetical protein